MHAFHGKMACATVRMQQPLIPSLASILTLPCSNLAGSIARTCAATGVGLHLVGPLGFRIDSSRLKRAGLDYWPYVAVNIYATWQVTSGHRLSNSVTPQRNQLPAIRASLLTMATYMVQACLAARTLTSIVWLDLNSACKPFTMDYMHAIISGLCSVHHKVLASMHGKRPILSIAHSSASNCPFMLQEFYDHFQELQGPKRLLALSKGGSKHYATPGEPALLCHRGTSIINKASSYAR